MTVNNGFDQLHTLPADGKKTKMYLCGWQVYQHITSSECTKRCVKPVMKFKQDDMKSFTHKKQVF